MGGRPHDDRLGAVRSILSVAVCGLAALPSTPAAAQAPGLSSEDLRALRSVGDVQISPDGARIAYTVSYRDGPGTAYSRIHVLDRRTGRSKRFGAHEGRGSNPRWSPDGCRIAWLGSDGERSGLWVAGA